MLHSAGLAIKALTNRSSSDHDEHSPRPRSIDQQKENFTAAASQYFSLLSSVDVRLRRQIYALEEAEIIPAEAASKEQQTSSAAPPGSAAHATVPNPPPAKQATAGKSASTGGGLGALDVGWLNSRNDKVGKEMEAELWGKARDFVLSLEDERICQDDDIDLFVDNETLAPQSARETDPA